MSERGNLPTSSELAISAELWNALATRVSKRTDSRALFSTRDKAVRIAVMALDAATDEWLVGEPMAALWHEVHDVDDSDVLQSHSALSLLEHLRSIA